MRWLRAECLKDEFATHLEYDIAVIDQMLAQFGHWEQAADGKISVLARLILNDHADEKVLVFTEYSDTANYVARSLQQRGVEGVAVVTGETGAATELARKFSPGSHLSGLRDGEDELRVLVSTMCCQRGKTSRMPA